MERKKFLKSLPLIGLGGGMLLAGCNTTSSTDIGPEENELEGDALLVKDAAKLDAIAVKTYTAAAAAAEAGEIELDQAVVDTAVLFRSHHMEHLEVFNELLLDMGGDEVGLDDFEADSRISLVASQTDVVELAMTMEYEAASTYFSQMVNQLTQTRTKELFGDVYPIELAHCMILKNALGRTEALKSGLLNGQKPETRFSS